MYGYGKYNLNYFLSKQRIHPNRLKNSIKIVDTILVSHIFNLFYNVLEMNY